MPFCYECGLQISGREKFCQKCGSSLIEPPGKVPLSEGLRCSRCKEPVRGKDEYCQNCGAILLDSSKIYFCSSCGTEMRGNFCTKCGKPFTVDDAKKIKLGKTTSTVLKVFDDILGGIIRIIQDILGV